jgi:hypothetical protein
MDELTKDLASKVVNGLYGGQYEVYADNPADGDEDLQQWVDALGDLADKHSLDMVTALADFVEAMSEHVNVHEVERFFERTFRGSGHEKGAILKAHAEHEEFSLGKLWEMLNKSGGMDSFNWNDFADSGSPWVSDLVFIEVPTTGSADTIYLFQED